MTPPLLASASYDQSIRIWDIGSASPVESFPHKESQINVMQFVPEGTQLAIGGWQLIRLYDIQSCPPAVVSTCDSLPKNIMSLGFEERGQWMFTGGEDCTAKVWDFRCSLQCQRIFQVSAAVNTVALHPNQVVLIVADSSGALYIWDLRRDTSETLASFELDISEYIVHLDVNRTGEVLIAVTNRGKLLIWSLGDMPVNPTSGIIIPMTLKEKLTAHAKYGLRCRFAPNGKQFATAGADGCAHIWDVDEISRPKKTLSVDDEQLPSKVEAKWVWDCAFTNDSAYLITASGCQLRLWDIDAKQVKRQYQGHNKTITAMAFKDGK